MMSDASRLERPRTGLNALKARVKVRGLTAIDGRTVAARALLDWQSHLVADLGGEAAISAQQRALVEVATRSKLYIDHLDAFLMEQRSLVNARRKAVLPALRERQTLADSLARILGQLGLERRQAPAKSLQDVIAEIQAGKAGPEAPAPQRAAKAPEPSPAPPARAGRTSGLGRKSETIHSEAAPPEVSPETRQGGKRGRRIGTDGGAVGAC